MPVLGNVTNPYLFSQIPSRLIAHSISKQTFKFDDNKDTFQLSAKSSNKLAFSGVHSSLVNHDGVNVGEEAANNDEWTSADTNDSNLVGKIESDVLISGTTYFFTKHHRGLYQLEAQRSSMVKRPHINWIAGLSDSEAKKEYEKRLEKL